MVLCVVQTCKREKKRNNKSWLISMIYLIKQKKSTYDIFKVISNMVHVKMFGKKKCLEDRDLQVKWYEREKTTEPKNLVHYPTYGMLRTVDASFFFPW